jgi:catalase
MRFHRSITAALALGLLAATAQAQTPPTPTMPERAVNALEGLFGAHAGQRRAHPKGFCVRGAWISTGAGAALSTAPSLAAGARIPVQGRFSLAGGNPNAPDNADNARGLALHMALPGGQVHDFVMISLPLFAVRTPEDFAQNLEIRRPDPATGKPDAEKIAAFVAARPGFARSGAWFRANPPSDSYASAPYFGVHTFLFRNAAGQVQPARWSFEPVGGRRGMTPEDRQRLGPDFLGAELAQRLAQGPAEWRVMLSFPEAGDPLTDATEAWPAERRSLEVARLVLDKAEPKEACERMMFSPIALPDGIAPSDDPVLRFRTAAYAVSFSKRVRGQ